MIAGRTLFQQALPFTFGGKATGRLLGVIDTRRWLRADRSGLVVQLGRAAGTLEFLGADGPTVRVAYAAPRVSPSPMPRRDGPSTWSVPAACSSPSGSSEFSGGGS